MNARISLLFSLVMVCTSLGQQVGPWKLDSLYETPLWETTSEAQRDGMKGILYDSIPYKEERVQVFAYYGVPEGEVPNGGWPAVVCVHGGGGTAFHEWVAKWNEHGYAAISMDLEGHYPINKTDRREDGRISTLHPGPSRVGIFGDYEKPVEEQWYYHAVGQIVLAHSLIRSFPEVNPERIGVTGISWGGTLTSTVMGVDDRFKFAIPVYGCGYIPDSDSRQGLAIKPGEHTDIVNTYFDGSAYFRNVRIPTFWLNGTNDGAFSMPSTQRSANATLGPSTLRYELEMRHGHRPGWEPKEIYAFADSVVRGAPGFLEFGKVERKGNHARIAFESELKAIDAMLYYTVDTGPWPERKWTEASAALSDSTIVATLPDEAVAFYFSATDERGLMVSSEFTLAP